MPVLDAKALDLDPEGAAFLKSVLRQYPLAEPARAEAPKTRIGRVHFHYRVIRRKELLTGMV
jgi:hypothetical protein